MSINKKAAIGETLSWFAGFLIIFFIIIIFLSASIIFSSSKKISGGSDEVILQNNLNKVDIERILIDFLDKPVVFDGKPKIKWLVIKSLESSKEDEKIKIKEKLKEELDKILEEYYGKNGCYLFSSKYAEESQNLDIPSFDVCSFSCNEDKRFEQYIKLYKKNFLSKSIIFKIFSDKQIEIQFYLGECL